MELIMNNDKPRTTARLIRAVSLLACIGASLLGMTAANAMMITGNMGIAGGFNASGGIDLSDASQIDLTSVYGTSGTDLLGTTVGFFTFGSANNSSITIDPFTPPQTNLLTIGGWQLDLTTLNVVDQTSAILTMAGTGVLSGNGYENTNAVWTFSAQDTGSSYSMTIAAVPLPATFWLIASGLFGLVTTARRKH
jgi:hypothetical protein